MIQVLLLSNPRFHFLGYFGRSSKIQSGGQNAFLWTRGLEHALVRRWQWILLRQTQTMFTHVYVDSETRHNLQNEPKRIKIGHTGNPSPRSIEGFGRILNGQPFEDAGSNNRATFPATINCASFINNTTMPASWQLNMCMLHLVKTNAVLVYMCFCESSCRRYCSSVLLQATKILRPVSLSTHRRFMLWIGTSFAECVPRWSTGLSAWSFKCTVYMWSFPPPISPIELFRIHT